MLRIENAGSTDQTLLEAGGRETVIEAGEHHNVKKVDDTFHLVGSGLVRLTNEGEDPLHLFLDGERQREIAQGESVGVAGPAVITLSPWPEPVELPSKPEADETEPGATPWPFPQGKHAGA